MSDIFLAYARQDRKQAQRLAASLTAQGWSVFIDDQILVGKRWHKAIEEELFAARAVVSLWSIHARESDYVLEEADYGKTKGILFPAVIEQVEFPYGYRHTETADLVGWTGEDAHPELIKLLHSLRTHLDGVGPASPLESPVITVETQNVPQPGLGTVFRDRLASGGEGPPMVVIPAGRFRMGSLDSEALRHDTEGPVHEVHIARPFALGKYTVTFDDYALYTKASGAPSKWVGQQPVTHVSWNDAVAYCAWLSTQTGHAYRLPSEAEWEYACRAGAQTLFHFGDRIDDSLANFDARKTCGVATSGKFRARTCPGGSFPANAFGLHDMHGNVWEWCQDTWHENYRGAPVDGSAWVSEPALSRVARGGSWKYGAAGCRAAARIKNEPNVRLDVIGFRVCRGSPTEP